MAYLHELLAALVEDWRKAGYPAEKYSTISEILEFAVLPELHTPRFLRWPQIRALETYWYLRFVENTPHAFEIYRRHFSSKTTLLDSLGLKNSEVQRVALDEELDGLWRKIRTDDAFVKRHKLESMRETLTLAYPSYIFA